MKISISELETLTMQAIKSYGYDDGEAASIKDVLLYAQLRGNNQGIVKLIGKGIPKNPDAGEIEIVKDTPISAKINGNKNHAMIVMNEAAEIAVKKAKENGFGLVGVYNTNTSSGAIGYYVSKISAEGMIGFAFASGPERVAANGSYEPIYGTNPIAIAIPAKPDDVILDMSTAAMSFYGLIEAKTAGKDIPDDVAYDAKGHKTTNPAEAIQGALRSFDRSYKSSGLGMVTEILGGALVGAAFAGIGDSKGNWGHLIYAIDPELMGSREEFAENVSRLVEKVKSTKKLEPATDILAPGARGSAVAKANIETEQIEIEDNLQAAVKERC